jgi:chemotaxis protein CheC
MGAGFVGKPIKKETVEQVLGVAGLAPAKAEQALINLTPSEHDALSEVFNIAIGAAADIMNQMVRDEVTLNVPSFDFVSRDEMLRLEGGGASQRVCAVTQRVGGIFDSEAMLLFKEDKALAVVNTILGTEAGTANSVTDFAEEQEDVIKEIGNIVLNAAVAAIADMFGAEFQIAPPRCHVGLLGDILGRETAEDSIVLLLVINFTLQHREIQGRIAFMMDVPAMEDFRRRVHALIDAYNG